MKRSDDGMTLIELLISISLLTVIMGALVTAMLLVLDTTDSTRQKITDSTGAQLVTSWLVGDAQSSQNVQPTGANSCGGTPILELRWQDANSAIDGTVDVQYVSQDAGNGNFELVRNAYSVNGAGVCSSAATNVLVRAIDPAQTAAVCVPGPPAVCNDNSTQVGLHVTALSQDPKTGNYSAYPFDALGSRRTQ